MKKAGYRPAKDVRYAEIDLCKALAAMKDQNEIRMLIRDLCTPAELEAIADRWRVVPLLKAGVSYREIHDRTGVSVTTIGRVARYIDAGNGGYQLAYQRLHGS